MFKQKPFPFSLIVLIILVALHLVGSYYSWYWVYSWFDILVHIFGGLWIASVFLWLASFLEQINSLKEYKIKSFLIAFVSATLFGVVWEIVENYSQITFITAPGYSLNTALDIFNGMLGGLLAYLYFIKRKKQSNKVSSAEILHPFYDQTGIIKI